jgi:DNA segregation ATPase FtsK/SpoIIIE-like protein
MGTNENISEIVYTLLSLYDEGKIFREDVVKSLSDYIERTTKLPEVNSDEPDELYEQAVEVVRITGKASTALFQQRLKIGYARAWRLIDRMEDEGLVGPAEGSNPREVFVS